MDKKDIYEHLAKIYLDASLKKKKKTKKYSPIKKSFFISIIVISGLSLLLLTLLNLRKNYLNSEVALILCPDVVKINFHFDPAKKETYSIDLNKLNLTKFKALGFSVKKAVLQDNISLRVEFVNSFKEKSEVYIKDVPHKWHDYKIPLSDFKNISNWSELSKLSFIVEEWNVREKKSIVYLDNVRFLR